MSSDDGFVAQIVGGLSRALAPLVEATSSPEALAALLAELGWAATPGAEVVAAAGRANAPLEALAADVAAKASSTALLADVAAAMAALGGLESTSTPGAGAPFGDPAFWSGLPADLFALLVHDDLQQNKPRLYGFLSFLGVLRIEPRPADATTGRQAYAARVVDLGALARAAAAPGSWLADVYGWGGSFDHDRFLTGLGALGGGLGGAVSEQQPPATLAARYIAPDNPDRSTVRVLSLSPIEIEGPTLADYVKAALIVLPLPPADDRSAPPEGLFVQPLVTGAAAAGVDLGPAAALTLDGDFEASPVSIELRPSGTNVNGASADLAAGLRLDVTPQTPFVMVGSADGTHLELRRAHAGTTLRGTGAGAEVVIEAALDEAYAVLDLGAADSFLRSVLGTGDQSLPVAVGMTWSSTAGLTFSGGPRPSVSLPVDFRIAEVLSVTELTVELAAAGADALQLIVSVVGGFELGPFSAIAERLGLRMIVAPATFAAPGNLGLVDLSLGFAPPTAIGLALDVAGIVTGGGFVSHDDATGRYVGGLALEAFGVGIGAVVLVDTELPGDPDGFALFASLGVTFPTPLPIGFGFTLVGVGGLLALDRTIDVDELAAAMRDGAADSILFPQDVEQDADAILQGLDRWFPGSPGTTVVGPVAEIGWGSPTLISAQLAVVVAFPDVIVTLLGSVEMLLPTPDEPVLTMHMDVVGAVDVAAATVTIAASLHDSNLLGIYQLSGDMGFYACFSGQPQFVLSVGGYSPDWKPPGALPDWLLDLRRIRAAVPLGAGVSVTFTSYIAVTSNSLQFGGRVHIVASVEVLLTTYTADGWFGLNVLLVLRPFTIKARATAGVTISSGDKELLGVDLHTRIEGPQPWYAHGRAEFTFFGIDVPFTFEIGDEPGGEPRQTHDVAADVTAAVTPPAGWQTVDSGDSWGSGVVVDDELPAGLWARPDQLVEVRQSVAPLNRTMTAFGEYVPVPARIDATAVTLGGDPVASPAWIDDWFAPAQFDRLGDTTRLSAPSYELMTAGVRFGDDGVAVSTNAADCTSVSRKYEESIWPDGAGDTSTSPYTSPATSLARAPAVRTVAGPKLELLPTTYTVVRTSDGETAGSALADAGLLGVRATYAQATALIETRAAADPAERRRLRVVPDYAAVDRTAA